jgi:hypothetical protein
MTGFKVNVEALLTAGARATEAGERALAVDLLTLLDAVAGALPGSAAEHAAPTTAEVFQTALKNWAGKAAEHGRNLTASAQLYQEKEAAAVDFFRQVLGWF